MREKLEFDEPGLEFDTLSLNNLKEISKDLASFVLRRLIRTNETLYSKLTVLRMSDEYQFGKIEAKRFLYLLSKSLKLSIIRLSHDYNSAFKFPSLFFANLLICFKNNDHLSFLILHYLYLENLTVQKISDSNNQREYEKIFFVISSLLANEKFSLFETLSDLNETNPVSLNIVRAVEKNKRNKRSTFKFDCISVTRNESYSFYREFI